jgi:hypothetical protein
MCFKSALLPCSEKMLKQHGELHGDARTKKKMAAISSQLTG